MVGPSPEGYQGDGPEWGRSFWAPSILKAVCRQVPTGVHGHGSEFDFPKNASLKTPHKAFNVFKTLHQKTLHSHKNYVITVLCNFMSPEVVCYFEFLGLGLLRSETEWGFCLKLTKLPSPVLYYIDNFHKFYIQISFTLFTNKETSLWNIPCEVYNVKSQI